MPRLHSGAATDRPEVTHLTLPPIPEVVWQQPQENHVTNIHNDLTNEIQNDTHTPTQKNDVEAQTSPIKETSPQKSGSDTESPLESQTRSIPVQCLDNSNKQPNEIQRNEISLTTYNEGDDNISPPEITTSQIQEQLVRDENTNELYMPLSSTIVLKRKKEMLYVPLDFENGLTIDALVDSGAYVSAIAQTELDRIKQQAPSNILKIDDPPNFQIQVANGQLEKPTATATPKFDIGDHTFAEHFVVMKNWTGPFIGLHFMKHNSVVIDTTHGLILFPHLTMQVKSALSQASAKPQTVLILHREKHYYPKMAQLIREWVLSCKQCLGESQINPRLTRPPLESPSEYITAPEDAMQIDLVPGLPPSGGYENIVTAIDVFSRYLFADPTSNQDAKTVAQVLINIMTKHAYLPTTLISDKGTAFTSSVIKEVAGVLGITLKHATTKHAQTIGLLERSHASIKQALKIETGERRSLWHKYVSIAVLNYYTSYHASIGCEPSRVFHGRVPYNILDLKMGICPQKIPPPDSQIAQDVLEQTELFFQDVRKNAMQAYLKYKAYYDRKANASKLKKADYVFILQPKADHQGSKIPFTDFRWIGPYIIEKVLPNNSYLVRKIGTNKTQILHRMRLRKFTPRQPLPDVPVTQREWQPDPEVVITHDDLYARAWECEYDEPMFDSDHSNLAVPSPPEITVRSEQTADEMRNNPGIIPENSPEIIPQPDGSYDERDVDRDTQPDADTSVEQFDPMPTNPRSSKYDLRHNSKPNCNDDYRY